MISVDYETLCLTIISTNLGNLILIIVFNDISGENKENFFIYKTLKNKLPWKSQIIKLTKMESKNNEEGILNKLN